MPKKAKTKKIKTSKPNAAPSIRSNSPEAGGNIAPHFDTQPAPVDVNTNVEISKGAINDSSQTDRLP